MEKPLRVLMCAYAVDNNDVGEANLTWHWIDNIAKHAEVTLITAGSRIHDVCGFENHPKIRLIYAKPKIRFQWTGAFDRVLKPDYFEFYWRARKIAKTLAHDEQFDAAHHIAPHSPRYPTPLHSLGLKLLIGPIHGGLHMPAIGGWRTAFFDWCRLFSVVDALRKKFDPLLRVHFSSAYRLLISAPYVKESLPQEYVEKAVVIPPQPPEILRDNIERTSSKKLRLIFVGRLIESKGIRLAISALRYANTRNVEFLVYGRGPLRKELEGLVRQYGLEDSVIFKGFVSHEEVLRAFYTSDVLLFPSLKEAWGLVVSEAMASGMPVICVDRGGPSYMVTNECGVRVPIGREEQMCRDIASAIDGMGSDMERTKRMGQAARRRIAEDFTWEILTEKLLDLYQGKAIAEP